MSKTLVMHVQNFNEEAGFVAWFDNEKFRGMVVQANSLEEVLKELFVSLRIKVACDMGIELAGIDEKIQELILDAESLKHNGKKELNFNLA